MLNKECTGLEIELVCLIRKPDIIGEPTNSGEAGSTLNEAAHDGYEHGRDGVADMREKIEEVGHDVEGKC